PRGRSWRDRLAKTQMIDLFDETQPDGCLEPGTAAAMQAGSNPGAHPGAIAPQTRGWGRSAGNGALSGRSAATITVNQTVNPPEPTNLILSPIGQRGLAGWVRQNPGTAIVSAGSIGLVIILGTFAATQLYAQDQANRRAAQEQQKELLLDLVAKYSQNAPDQRRGSVLALGAIKDPNPEIVLLLNLLGQEESPQLIEALQQSITSAGPTALPYLQRLNQTLKTDADSLAAGPNTAEATQAALRLRATQRAIAKLLRLRSGANEPIDLSRVDLGQSNSPVAQFSLVLDRADLSGLNLRSAVLTGANLRGSVFRSAGPDGRWNTFDDALTDLSGADLRGADLTGASLLTGQLERASLVGAALNRTNLSNARLTGANLSRAKLLGANLDAATLDQASLTGADLGDATLNQASLHEAKLGQARAISAKLVQADLTAVSWRGGDLSSADLNRANLQNADLSASRLVGANLQGAKLQNATLQGTDFSQADLRGATFEGANLKGAIFAPAAAAPAGGFVGRTDGEKPSALVKGADFSQAKNLDPRQLAYLCTQGAIHPQCPQ
ncbi:MAG TPA: pentapeptide repeat-containing protein, partial [Coleofasciculaceae cyanobacterium]